VKEVVMAALLLSSFLTIVGPNMVLNKTYFLPGETLKVYVSGNLLGKLVKLYSPNGSLVAEERAKLGLSLEYTFSKEDPPGTWKILCGEEEREVHLLSPYVAEEIKFPKIPPKVLWISAFPPKSYLSPWNVSVGVFEFNGISCLKGEAILISPAGRKFSAPLKFFGKVNGTGRAEIFSDEEMGEWKVIVEVENGPLKVRKEENVFWNGSPPEVHIKLRSYEIPCYVKTELEGTLTVASRYSWKGELIVENGSKELYEMKISGNGSEELGFGIWVKLNPGKYVLKAEVSDPFGNGSSEAFFRAVDFPPRISLQVSPEKLPFGLDREIDVKVKVTDPNGDLKSVSLELISPDGKIVEKLREGVQLVNLTSPGNWTITCVAKDEKNVREKSFQIYAYDLPPEIKLLEKDFKWRMGEVRVNYRVSDPNGEFDLKWIKAEIVSPLGEKEVKTLNAPVGNVTFYAKAPGIWEVFLKASDREGEMEENATFLRILGFEGIGVKDPEIKVNGTCLLVGTFQNIGDLKVSSIYVKVSGINWSKAEVIYGGKEIGEGKGEITLSEGIPPGGEFLLKILLMPPLSSGEHQVKVEVFSG